MRTDIIKLDEKFEIESYSSVGNFDKAVSFSGSLAKHPYEDDKFILISDPLSDHTEFIEFYKKDVVGVEELPSISSENNESITMKRIWISNGSAALRMQPFIVTKTKFMVFKK